MRATEAGVLGAVTASAERAGHVLPVEVADTRVVATARHLVTLHDLTLVSSALDGAGIPWAVMKGPALRVVVFSDPSVRDYADLDVLVGPHDIRAAVHALIEGGCTLGPADWDAATKSRTAELTLICPRGTHLDLHWGLVNAGRIRTGYRLEADIFLARRVRRRVDGVDLATFDDLDLALHTMLHACISGASSLRWLLDTQQCVRWLESSGGIHALEQRALEHKLGAPTRAVVDAAGRHIDAGLLRAALVGPATLWTVFLSVVSRRRLPSAPSAAFGSPSPFFAATRSTTLRSLRALAETALTLRRYSRSGWPRAHPRLTTLDDPGLEEWLQLAEREPRRLGSQDGA